MQLQYADLSFTTAGTPQSNAFGDVYFSNDDGIAESEYVFIAGNRLLTQWQNWPHAVFCIGETGFGTGLNFLLTLRYFDAFLLANPTAPLKHLHYISVEKFPIEYEALTQIHALWPSLAPQSRSVMATYPPALEGIHRSFHDTSIAAKSVTLDLVLGDAEQGLSHIHRIREGLVNAWYLDGFAPSKNESMWEPGVFDQMARLSAPGASVATFTAAGAVKRGLQAAGFSTRKIKGYARKREMIVAVYDPENHDLASPPSEDHHAATNERSLTNRAKPNQTHNTAGERYKARPLCTSISQPPYFQRANHHSPSEKITSTAIVGGGIAGALLALRLVQQGIKVSLICKDDGPAQGASGNPVGGFYPQLNAQAGVNSQFFVHAFLYARRFYDDLIKQNIAFEHDWCGVLQLGFNPNTALRLDKIADKFIWPKALAQVIDAAEATKIAGVDIPHSALYLPAAGWIAPVSLIQACLHHAQKNGLLTTLYQHTVLSYQTDDSSHGVSIALSNQLQQRCTLTADTLIIAAGSDSPSLTQEYLPMRLTRGQVEAIAQTEASAGLRTVLCHKGYFTPAINGHHALGSSYIKNDMSTAHRQDEVIQNLDMHQAAMRDASWMQTINQADIGKVSGRAAIRCSTPDHLPLVGAMPNIQAQTLALADLYKALPAERYAQAINIKGVYVLTGLGSRGITSAPILVDTLVAEITGQALPMSNTLLNAVSPNRFLVRALIRQLPYSAVAD
jgi:tRNA 5-methylaminomethyl-2-thiouridine biosynthesis bifunctional protein